MYPVLPEDKIQSPYASEQQPTVVMAEQKYHNRDIAGDVEMQPRNSSSKQLSIPSAPIAVNAVPMTASPQNVETPALINDLLSENNRLRQQIEELHARQAQTQQRTGVDATGASGPAITGMSTGRIQARYIGY